VIRLSLDGWFVAYAGCKERAKGVRPIATGYQLVTPPKAVALRASVSERTDDLAMMGHDDTPIPSPPVAQELREHAEFAGPEVVVALAIR